MSIKSFVPELWNAAIQEPYEKSLVYGQSSIASTGYFGQISGMGDTVHFNTLTAPTIKEYDKDADLTIEDLTTADNTLKIDQGKYFAFGVNDVDKVQAAGDLQGPATRAAATGLRDGVDKFIAGKLKDGALSANKLGTLQVVNDDPDKVGNGQTTAFKTLVKLSEKLNMQSVPTTGRWVVVGPKTYSALLMDPRFTKVDASGTAEGLRNAIVGRAIGFEVMVSNNAPSTSGRELAIAGVPGAFVFASQLVETEALRDPSRFRDIVRGLNVYGAGVVRPEGIATADLNIVDPAGSAVAA
ncbi:TPA: hypothetical protein NJV00_000855 [Corynebacterium striatum]|nr:hypothetical protein [Corynebacterium striatum]HCG3160761.1 hypothetical protein [Corynebacterium striatum]